MGSRYSVSRCPSQFGSLAAASRQLSAAMASCLRGDISWLRRSARNAATWSSSGARIVFMNPIARLVCILALGACAETPLRTTPSAAPRPANPTWLAVPVFEGAAPGALTSVLVHPGQFHGKAAQEIQVLGTGLCSVDLHITSRRYGELDVTWDLPPLDLGRKPVVYFVDAPTDGSYSLDARGVRGCDGTVQIGFDVSVKSASAAVAGEPANAGDPRPRIEHWYILSSPRAPHLVSLPGTGAR